MSDESFDGAAAREGGGHASNWVSLPFDYCRRGWTVFPCHTVSADRCTCGKADCDSAGKHPRTLHGHRDATSDAVTVRRWVDTWGDAINWAVATGAASGLVVVDVDPRHGGDDSLAEWERRNGALPATLTALTGGGGRHLFFAYPGDGQPVPSRSNWLRGVDVKADGGYVILPPARHVSGRQYAWREWDLL